MRGSQSLETEGEHTELDKERVEEIRHGGGESCLITRTHAVP